MRAGWLEGGGWRERGEGCNGGREECMNNGGEVDGVKWGRKARGRGSGEAGEQKRVGLGRGGEHAR